MAEATTAENVPAIVAKSLQLANTVLGTISALDGIATAVRTLPGTGVPPAELNQFATELPTRLFDYLVVRRLEDVAGAAEVLDFIGFIERVTVPSSDPQHPAFTRRALHLDQLTAFVSDPLTQLRTKYQWGDASFTGLPLLQKLEALLNEGRVTASLDTTGPTPVLNLFFGEVRPKLDVDPKGLAITIDLPLALGTTFDEGDWHVRFVAKASLGGGVQIVIQPTDGVTVDPPGSAPVEGDLLLEVTRRRPDGSPYSILGDPGGSRLEATEITARAGAGLRWNATAGRAEGTFTIAAEMKGGKLVVSLAGADGFLGTILSGFGLETQFDVGLGYSSKEGVFFQGSATLDIQLPLHVQLGPVEISALTLTVGIENNTFPIGLRTNIKAMLGPLEAVVEQIGVMVNVSLPNNRKGNAGPVDFALAFAPPRGVGLSLDVGVIRGGGYLFLDPARGEYAGALELSLFEVVTIKAIGIITTKMPDGSNGFSLLIIMSVEFGAGIQLGFGFTLLAIGGLVGLNRTMKLQALADGIRSGAIESVMFLKDIIANAPKIISDLRVFFRPTRHVPDRPDGEVGWGTLTLVSLSLGIIIEIPAISRLSDSPDRAAHRRRRADQTSSQLHRRDRVRQAAPVLLRRAVRIAHRVPHHRWRDGPAGGLGRRCQLRRERGRIPPAVLTAAAAVPEPAADRSESAEHAGIAADRPGLLRRDVQHGAVRRAGRRVLRPRHPERQGPAGLRCAVPVLAVLLHHRDLRVALRQRVRRGTVLRQHPRIAQGARALEREGARIHLAPVLGHRRRLRGDLG